MVFNTLLLSASQVLVGYVEDNSFHVVRSYNPLPRVAGKIQYEAEAKPRLSICICRKPEEIGYNYFVPFAMAAGQTLHYNFLISINAECCVIYN